MQEITHVPEMLLHRLTTYELGDRFRCKADNLDPGACLTGVDGATREKSPLGKAFVCYKPSNGGYHSTCALVLPCSL